MSAVTQAVWKIPTGTVVRDIWGEWYVIGEDGNAKIIPESEAKRLIAQKDFRKTELYYKADDR